MKKSILFLGLVFFFVSCDKDVYLPQQGSEITKRDLSKSEATLKENLQATAKLMTTIIQDKMVVDELKTISGEGREFYEISFKDLLSQSVKGQNFKILCEKFLDACSSEAKGGEFDLAQYLIDNECYLYCPYPEEFYPEGTDNFTVAGHPIDNETEGPGFLIEDGVMLERTVNEEYSEINPVLLIMPMDPDQEDIQDFKDQSTAYATQESINEVRIGYVRCADYCGDLFEGTLELRIARGSPVFNPTTETLTGSYSVVMKINYPRDYARAAKRDWTLHNNGGWYPVNIVWDSNWRVEKVAQAILVYEYDQQKTKEMSATIGYKEDELSVAQTVKITATYSGDFLGLAEWDRAWFFATNTVAGVYDEVKYGWVVRKLSEPFKLTTPSRTF